MFGARFVTFQDFNREVLEFHTLPNCLLNPQIDRSRFDFVQLDWANEKSDHSQLFAYSAQNSFRPLPKSAYLGRKYRLIFAADVLYETKQYRNLLDLFANRLSADGRVVIATKYFYFGNRGNPGGLTGGGLYDFVACVEQDARFEYQVLKDVNTGKSNKRQIFMLNFK